MRQMFRSSEALSYRRIKAWTVFLLSVGVPDEKLFSVVEVIVFLRYFHTQIDIFEVLELKRRDGSITEVDDEFFLQVFFLLENLQRCFQCVDMSMT